VITRQVLADSPSTTIKATDLSALTITSSDSGND
jgi:hypothetical protein